MNTNKRPAWRNPWLVTTYVALLIVTILSLVIVPAKTGTAPKKVPLSVALSEVRAGHVTSASINDQSNTVTLTRTKTLGGKKLQSSYPFAYSGELTKALLAKNVKTTTAPPSPGRNPFVQMLLSMLPLIIFLALMVWLVRSGALTGNIGKFSGKRGQKIGEVPTARFTDVAGCDEAVAELSELVEFLNDGDRFARVGAKAPRGALLVGPPGTGKTLLARAVAGEAGVPFFAVAGSDFVETFAGVGAKRARDLFDKARACEKAIIFIDEIDAIGRTRSANSLGGGDTERENTLVSMLNEMDGFTASQIIVLAATNRADVLDPALTRPGRLDRSIQVPNPDRGGREQILLVHAAKKQLGDDVDLVSIARQTPGMSGADLAQVVNEACMEAARREYDVVDQDCFQAAIAAVALGRARTSALVTEHDRLITAWHEGGHTVAALVQRDADDPVSVTIVPRGPAGGLTWMSGNDNTFMTRNQALASLVTSLAGRAAEEILLDGEFTQGAVGDLSAATSLAREMVLNWGMTDFGLAQVDGDSMRMGGELANAAHQHVEGLLQDARDSARSLLRDNAAFLKAIAEALLNEETLSSTRIMALYAEVCRALAAEPDTHHASQGAFAGTGEVLTRAATQTRPAQPTATSGCPPAP